jgi:hypothetical protein
MQKVRHGMMLATSSVDVTMQPPTLTPALLGEHCNACEVVCGVHCN